MPEPTSFKVYLYSTRYSHDPIFEIYLSMQQMRVKGFDKTAICSYVKGDDPKWSGYNVNIGNPLEKILENDSIFPPTVFVRALEQAWLAWINGELNNEKILREVQTLCGWVNEITRVRPDTKFWDKIF